jgi:hypothetical protein
MDTGTVATNVETASAPGLVDSKSAASEPLESKSEAAAEEQPAAAEEKPAADSDEATSGNKRGSPTKDDEEPKEKKVKGTKN